MGVRYWNCYSGGAGNVWLNEGTDPATPLVVWSLGPNPCLPDAYGTGRIKLISPILTLAPFIFRNTGPREEMFVIL